MKRNQIIFAILLMGLLGCQRQKNKIVMPTKTTMGPGNGKPNPNRLHIRTPINPETAPKTALSSEVPLDYAMGTLRNTTGRLTTADEIDEAAKVIADAIHELRG